MVHYGLGRHQFYLELSPELSLQLSQVRKFGYISKVLLILTSMFTRVSICLFLLRIFGTRRSWKWGLYGILAFSVATNISGASSILMQCSPVQKAWHQWMPGTCRSLNTRLSTNYYNGGKSCLR